MARRYKKKRRSSKKKMPLLATMGVVGYVAPGVSAVISGSPLPVAISRMTGMHLDGTPQDYAAIAAKTAPIVVGVVGSAVASKFKLNRYLAGIPFIRL